MEDNWKDFISLTHIIKKQGKWGMLDLVLDDAEDHRTPSTDLLLYFNSTHLVDEAGNYNVSGKQIMINTHDSVFGKGSGIFERNNYTISLTAHPGTLFYPGTMWGDFTLQFWMKPLTLSDSEVILSWTGSRLYDSRILNQSIRCTLVERKVRWEFENFFLPSSALDYTMEFTGITPLLPRQWHHHILRFNSTTGLLEYYVDGVPEAVCYTTEEYTEGGSVCLPFIGDLLPGELKIGEYFTGLIDEFIISREFIDEPQRTRYSGKKGSGMTRVFDTNHTGSFLKQIQAVYSKPDETEIYFYYRTADILHLWNDLGTEWIQFEPGELFDENNRGRYIQLLVELFPDGARTSSPALSRITIVYEPDLPPPPPTDVIAVPGNRKVTLSWKSVNYQDVAGYEIYYGERPGYYHGREDIKDDSPVDAGNVTEFEIPGLENGKIYYFAVVVYDNSLIPHRSIFSKEVHARPSGLLE
ncbi:MAG: hypothetical protein JXB88_16055 [Spirochaetales bacterium]|nr:hypothetical protein [Spirochaetales bacterium]